MTELELLDKEIRELTFAEIRAEQKPNVSKQELDNIHTKLQLKRNIREIVRRELGV